MSAGTLEDHAACGGPEKAPASGCADRPAREPQNPQPPPLPPQPALDRDQPPEVATPTRDTRFSRSSLLHFGQAGLREPTTSASN